MSISMCDLFGEGGKRINGTGYNCVAIHQSFQRLGLGGD